MSEVTDKTRQTDLGLTDKLFVRKNPNRIFGSSHKTKFTVILVIFVLGLLAITWWIIASHHHHDDQTNQTQQRTLQSELSAATQQNDQSTIVSTTTQLIDGQNKGIYKIQKQDLSMDYLYRATAYLNLKQYVSSTNDFEQSMNLDNNNTEAALQGELQARYLHGERQELIPILQKLVQITKNNQDELNATPAQYQGMIKAIQRNQPLDL